MEEAQTDGINAWCIRVSWAYYDKEKTEVYIKSHIGFGALHDKKDENLHSHYYIKSKRSSKDVRNDINRYKLKNVYLPEGMKPLCIQKLKTSIGKYYRYVMTKAESKELWINGMEIPEFDPIVIKSNHKRQPNVIEKLLALEQIQLSRWNYSEFCGHVIDYYINNNKTVPMDSILKQICRTVWLIMLKKEDPTRYKEMRAKYISYICCDLQGVFQTNYDNSSLL